MFVLICEDDPFIAMAMEDAVRAAGGIARGPARSFDEAMALSAAAKPKVALVDLHLQDGRTGTAIARELAKHGTTIVVTSGDMTVDPQLGTISHVFLPKPINPVVLRELLAQAAPAGDMCAAAS